jgi:tetratricopeptide (TPR) repeat protein
MADNLFRQAAELVRAGQRDEARRLLAAELNDHPDNADAWMALALLVEDHERAIGYLEKVLELRPGDAEATRYLARLKALVAQYEQPTLPSARAATAALPATPAPAVPPVPAPPVPRAARRRVRLLPILAIVVGVLIVGLAGGALVANLLRGGGAPRSVDPSRTYEVVYLVTTANTLGGFNEARVVYIDDAGQTVEEIVNRRSWSRTFVLPRGGSASVLIEDLGTTASSLTCEIRVDGEPWRQEEASGLGAIAACAGTVGGR